MFDGIGQAMAVLFWTCIVSVPLGLWKLVEIVIWLFNHVSIEV